MMTVIVRSAFLALLLLPLFADVFGFLLLLLLTIVVSECFALVLVSSVRSSSDCLADSMPALVNASKLVRFGATTTATGVCSPLVSFDDDRFVTSKPVDGRFC